MAIRTAASVKALMDIKDVTKETAEAIRRLWTEQGQKAPYKFSRGGAREQIDAILRTCGVEFLGFHKRTGKEIYYCNAGDTYTTTVIFHGEHLRVGCWGDLAEAGLVREFEQY